MVSQARSADAVAARLRSDHRAGQDGGWSIVAVEQSSTEPDRRGGCSRASSRPSRSTNGPDLSSDPRRARSQASAGGPLRPAFDPAARGPRAYPPRARREARPGSASRTASTTTASPPGRAARAGAPRVSAQPGDTDADRRRVDEFLAVPDLGEGRELSTRNGYRPVAEMGGASRRRPPWALSARRGSGSAARPGLSRCCGRGSGRCAPMG